MKFTQHFFANFEALRQLKETNLDIANLHTALWLTNGWSFIGLARDNSEVMFEELHTNVWYGILYGFIHYFVSETIKTYNNMILPYYYVLFSVLIYGMFLSFNAMMIIAAQVIINVIAAYYGNTTFTWIYGIVCLPFIHYGPIYILMLWLNTKQHAMLYIGCMLLWNTLRYISYSINLEKIKSARNVTKQDFLRGAGYFFYFPTLFQGPLILYEDFEHIYHKKNNLSFTHIFKMIPAALKLIFYLKCTCLLQHFIYFGLLEQISSTKISYAAFYGFCLWKKVQFMMVCKCCHGLAILFAEADGINVCIPPQCGMGITLHSELWKYYDASIYKFFKKYIYIPIAKLLPRSSGRYVGGFITFGFSAIWFGLSKNIIIFCALNYIEVILEPLVLKQWKQRHVVALLSSLLFMLSLFSVNFFLNNYEIGMQQLERAFEESFWKTALVFIYAYLHCILEFEIKMRTNIVEKRTGFATAVVKPK